MALCCRALKPGKMKGSSETRDLAQTGYRSTPPIEVGGPLGRMIVARSIPKACASGR
jgi:hypothetical protein